MIKLAILGATGSIGEAALNLAEAFPEIKIVSLGCGRKVERLLEHIRKFRPEMVAVADVESADRLRALMSAASLKPRPEILWGPEGMASAATEAGAGAVLSAIAGQAGLIPTIRAVKAGLKVALANKESLVLGGELLMPLARAAGAEIVPVDSEHSAIFQALGGALKPHNVRRLILTASGGPFRGLKSQDLESVSLETALNHPRWRMGPKVTCDSATMMNKGLEIIEAHHLFGVPYEQIKVLVHPQSVVHSIVEYIDGSQMMQAGPTDMRPVIAYALSHPERWPLVSESGLRESPGKLDPLELASLTFNQWRGHLIFEEPDRTTFKALDLAEKAGRAGGTAPAVMCSANEEAVDFFLSGVIGFADIIRVVEKVMDTASFGPLKDMAQIFEAAAEGRRLAKGFVRNFIK